MDDFDIDNLEVPEADYEVETFDTTEDQGCDGGACKI